VARWLVARALEHDAPSALFSRAAEHLLARRIVRPTVDQLARTLATAREAAHYAVFDLLAWQLDERRKRELDRLLIVDERLGVAPIVWLREQPHGRVSEPLITQHIARFELLEQLRAGEVDLSALPPSRQRLLAARARRMSPRALRQMGPERRYPILLAFLAEAHIDRGDELISQYENALGKVWRTAGRKLDELRKDTDRDKAALARLGVRLSRLVLDAHRRGEQTVEIAEIEREIGLRELQAAVESNSRRRRTHSATTSCTSRSPGFRRRPGGSCAWCRCARTSRTAARSTRLRWLVPGRRPRPFRARRLRRSPRGSATGCSTIAGVRSARATSWR
jgi:hypothetical protein